MSAFPLDLMGITEAEPVIEDEPIRKGGPSPYPSLEIGAATVQPGVDEFYATEAYVWYQLVQEEGDLCLEEWSQDFIGEVPYWWEQDIVESGMEHLLDIRWNLDDLYAKVLDWALREGLMPEQPFLIVVTQPRWYQSGGYEYPNEWDWENEVYVARRLPPEISLRRFEQIVTEIFEDRRARIRLREAKAKARWVAHDRLYKTSDVYFPRGYHDGYGDHGAIVRLISSLHDVDDPKQRGSIWMLEGRDDNGDMKVAEARLREKALEKGIPAKVFDKLPWRRW